MLGSPTHTHTSKMVVKSVQHRKQLSHISLLSDAILGYSVIHLYWQLKQQTKYRLNNFNKYTVALPAVRATDSPRVKLPHLLALLVNPFT